MRLLTSTTLLIACAGCGGTDEDVKVAPGSARLTFHRQDGTLLEEVELSVVEVGSLEVTVPGGGVGFLGLEPPEWPRLLMRGGTDTFFLRMNDAAGERLLGFGPVQYTAPANAEVWDDRSDLALHGAVQPSQIVRVTAREVGPALVEGRAGVATLALDIEVVDASSVAELRWERRGGWFDVGDDVQRVRAFTAEGIEVHDPECDWTFDPPDHPELSSDRNHVSRSSDEPGLRASHLHGR